MYKREKNEIEIILLLTIFVLSKWPLLLTLVNDPDRICRSSGCDVRECRVLLHEEVRIGEARHVSPLGEIRMELIWIEMRVTCHGEGSLQLWIFALSMHLCC